MSKAVESIVRGYLLLNNRKALEDLLAHREKLLDGLNQVSGIDANLVVTSIREEIAAIQIGLDRIDGKAAEALQVDQVKVLRLTVSESPSSTGNYGSSAKPPPDPMQAAAHVEPASEQSAQGHERNRTIKVLGFAVSTGSAVAPPFASSRSVGGLDPNSSTSCAPSSNEPTQQVDHAKETETPHSAIQAFKSAVSFWKDDSAKP